jgi:tetratricopeptide (TPR) repeat protein
MHGRKLATWSGVRLWCVVWAAAGIVLLLATPTRAQSLSDRLARTIINAQQADLQRRFGSALVDDGRALQVDPRGDTDTQRQTLLRRAAVYEATKEYDSAEADLTAALDLAAPTAILYVKRGFYYMRRGRYRDALGDFAMGERIEPGNPRLRYAQGRAQVALGNDTAAVGLYDEAIRLDGDVAAFYLARAEAQIRLNQPGLAFADYNRAIDLKPKSPSDRFFAFLGRGFAALRLADNHSAIADFNSALALDPNAVEALLWRGYARELDGRTDLALNDYERAATVDPADRSARANVQRLRSN